MIEFVRKLKFPNSAIPESKAAPSISGVDKNTEWGT
jgi:hypothetical protein